MQTILAAAIGALLTAVAGYFFVLRQTKLQRQRKQQWKIYKALRALEMLDSERYAGMPLDRRLKESMEHRETILRNLVLSGLPNIKEIIMAANAMGFPDAKSRSAELKRLHTAILKRLDPKFYKAARELEEELTKLGLKEGDIISAETHEKIRGERR